MLRRRIEIRSEAFASQLWDTESEVGGTGTTTDEDLCEKSFSSLSRKVVPLLTIKAQIMSEKRDRGACAS